jgi:hypothetical protein
MNRNLHLTGCYRQHAWHMPAWWFGIGCVSALAIDLVLRLI